MVSVLSPSAVAQACGGNEMLAQARRRRAARWRVTIEIIHVVEVDLPDHQFLVACRPVAVGTIVALPSRESVEG